MPVPIRAIPRAFTIATITILSFHVASVLTLGTHSYGPLAGNLLQISASFLAAFFSYRAAMKLPGFSRSFWTLVAFSMSVWGIANLGWTFFEVILGVEPPPGSIIRFLFDTHGMFFVMAMFLNQEKEDSSIDTEEILDFLQIGILFFLIYFGMYFIPAESLDPKSAIARENAVIIWGHVGVVGLALIQWRRARLPLARQLFRGLFFYFLVYAVFSNATEFAQVHREIPTGTWLDLGWTIPLLCGAYWAASWEPSKARVSPSQLQPRSLFEILLTHGMFVFAPLLILYQVAQLGPGWRLLRFSLLGISFLSYAFRIGLTQFRQYQDEETVRRQTLAMDSSTDGISILNEKGIHIYANTSFARMLGLESPKQIIGLPWKEVYSLQAVEQLQAQIRASLERSAKWSSLLQLAQPDGRSLSVEFTVAAMPDGGTACVCRDLSDRKEAEKARAEAETKYRMLVEHVNAITYIAEIGIHGQWFYVSPQVESILGYTADEWLADCSGLGPADSS